MKSLWDTKSIFLYLKVMTVHHNNEIQEMCSRTWNLGVSQIILKLYIKFEIIWATFDIDLDISYIFVIILASVKMAVILKLM